MVQFNQSLMEDMVDNAPSVEMISSGSFEAQMYHDLVNSTTVVDENGYDEYGHKISDYNQYGHGLQQRQEVLQSTPASLAFFRDINNHSI
jgi:hypothetical protein